MSTYYDTAISTFQTLVNSGTSSTVNSGLIPGAQTALNSLGMGAMIDGSSSLADKAYDQTILNALIDLRDRGILPPTRTNGLVDLTTSAMLGRTALVEQQINALMDKIDTNNQQVDDLNGLAASLNAIKPAATATTTYSSKDAWVLRLKDYGIPIPTTSPTDPNYPNNTLNLDQFTTISNALQSAIDSRAQTQQLDTVRLQSLNSRRSDLYEMLSNLLSKFFKTNDSVVANWR